MDIEAKWIGIINKEYTKDKNRKNLTKEDIMEIQNITVSESQMSKNNLSSSDLKIAKKIISIYNMPRYFIAYIDGDEDGDKISFSKNDVIFYVVDDSLDIVELMLNEYYSNYVYLIPKKYLKLDSNKYYKILDYKKLVLSSKNDRNYRRIDISDKDTFMKIVHRFIFEKIILDKD